MGRVYVNLVLSAVIVAAVSMVGVVYGTFPA